MTDEPPLNTADGFTVSVYFPPGSDPEWVSDFLSRVAADADHLPHDTDDAFVVGHAGDVLGIDHDTELTRSEALELVDELGQQAYTAEDRLAFIAEMCDLADRNGEQVTTERVRTWLAYQGCGGAIVLPEDVQERLAAKLADTEPGTDPIEIHSYERGYSRGFGWMWRCSGIRHCRGGFIGLDHDSETSARAEADRHARETHGDVETVKQLHARSACPGWEYATTEGPRKAWDDVDRPPSDEHGDPDPSWERNMDAGRDGWERFDYTEESYWRRPATEPKSVLTPEQLARLDTEGVDTTGCDCGHEGMGAAWHRDWCAWRKTTGASARVDGPVPSS